MRFSLPTQCGLFLLSICFLILEMMISRVMSALAWYHFAFLAISLAMLGVTLGSVLVHFTRQFCLSHFEKTLAMASIGVGGGLLLFLAIAANRPLFLFSPDHSKEIYQVGNLALTLFSVCVPFVCLGVVLSLLFVRFGNISSQVYGVNLLGSALGCLLFIPLLNSLSAQQVFFVLSLLCSLSALAFLWGRRSPGLRSVSGFQLVLSALLLQGSVPDSLFQFHWMKGVPSSTPTYALWNSFSYLRAFYQGRQKPQGWGFSPKKLEEILSQSVEQFYLDIDGAGGTTMTRFDGDLTKVNWLKYDITALAHYLIPDAEVGVIGVGSGRDVLTALVFQQKRITGIEINGGILRILNSFLGEFSGHLDRNPRIQFVNDEARSYIASAENQFDIIQLSLIDTFAASLSGAYALTENGLYTADAMESYLKKLSDRGVLTLSYWYGNGLQEYLLRLVATANLALSHLDIPPEARRSHLLIIHRDGNGGRGVSNILLKRTPFLESELGTLRRIADELGFRILLSPTDGFDKDLERAFDPSQLKEFQEHLPKNILPTTDDSPFFFL